MWDAPYVHSRIPRLYNLRTGSYGKATATFKTHWDRWLGYVYVILQAQDDVAKFLTTVEHCRLRQKAASRAIEYVPGCLKVPAAQQKVQRSGSLAALPRGHFGSGRRRGVRATDMHPCTGLTLRTRQRGNQMIFMD